MFKLTIEGILLIIVVGAGMCIGTVLLLAHYGVLLLVMGIAYAIYRHENPKTKQVQCTDCELEEIMSNKCANHR